MTRELECLFFLWRKAQFFFPEFNIRLHDKNSESDYFFFLHQNQNIFLEKNHNPPLQVKWSVPNRKRGLHNESHYNESH